MIGRYTAASLIRILERRMNWNGYAKKGYNDTAKRSPPGKQKMPSPVMFRLGIMMIRRLTLYLYLLRL